MMKNVPFEFCIFWCFSPVCIWFVRSTVIGNWFVQSTIRGSTVSGRSWFNDGFIQIQIRNTNTTTHTTTLCMNNQRRHCFWVAGVTMAPACSLRLYLYLYLYEVRSKAGSGSQMALACRQCLYF